MSTLDTRNTSRADRVRTMPSISGPITAGRRGHPFAGSLRDLTLQGYEEVEYFISGEARKFKSVGEVDEDGRWSVAPEGSAPYRTRLLVRRPRDPSKFNGTVVLYWTNVSVGFESIDDSEVVLDGYALVAVSAQQAGIDGFAAAPFGLKVWDPERYGSLAHPGDSYSFDIFTQAARAVGNSDARSGVDPLDGLPVRKIIALGASQSASRLLTYANAFQPREQVLDAIIATLSFGLGAPLSDHIYENVNQAEYTASGMRNLGLPPARVRDDLEIPVMIVNSETETLPSYLVRQPETDVFRFWEVAGASHAPGTMMEMRKTLLARDGLPDFLGTRDFEPSHVDISAVSAAALHAVHRWITQDIPARSQPRIEVAGNPPQIVRDACGIALGGIRLPDVAVPLATNTSLSDTMTGLSGLGGRKIPFSEEQVRTLYPTDDDYVSRVEVVVRDLVASGVLLERDGAAQIDMARAVRLP